MINNPVIEEGAHVGKNAIFGANVWVKKGAFIGDNVIIGYSEPKTKDCDNSEIPRTTVEEDARVRSGTVIYAGCSIGQRSSIGHNTVVRDNTHIGHDTYIGSLVSIEGETVIGNFVGIQTQCYITRFCRIDDYTFIAPRFAGANDPFMTHRRSGHGKALKGFTTDKYVRIGINVTALPGVHFGEGSIVGAGSLVTKDVPPYKIVYGSPARIIREAPRDQNPLERGD